MINKKEVQELKEQIEGFLSEYKEFENKFRLAAFYQLKLSESAEWIKHYNLQEAADKLSGYDYYSTVFIKSSIEKNRLSFYQVRGIDRAKTSIEKIYDSMDIINEVFNGIDSFIRWCDCPWQEDKGLTVAELKGLLERAEYRQNILATPTEEEKKLLKGFDLEWISEFINVFYEDHRLLRIEKAAEIHNEAFGEDGLDLNGLLDSEDEQAETQEPEDSGEGFMSHFC